MSPKNPMTELEQAAREEVFERVNAGDADRHGDFLHEIADSLVPIYHADLLHLAAWNAYLATNEPEIGPAFDGKPTPVNIIAANVYERLYEEAAAAWEEAKTNDDREETEKAGA